jgi:hypothetical protein
MFTFLRSWSAGKLFASWIAYWVVLIAVGLGPASAAIWRVSRAAGEKGSVALSFGDGVFSLKAINAGATVYSGSIHVLPLTLLVAGPPLLIWLAWFASRSKRDTPDLVGR